MKVLISSLNFSPAFIGSMKAWYKLCLACGYSVKLYFDKKYIRFFEDEEYEYTTKVEDVDYYKPDIVIVLNISLKNIGFFKKCKKNNYCLFYILHEPYMGLTEIIKEGNYAHKELMASIINYYLCFMADRVIICSQFALANCKKYMKSTLQKLELLPLLFLDDFDPSVTTEREYFSMIGTYALAHGSDIFLDFMKEAYKRGLNIKFQIATRSNLLGQLTDPIYKQMENKGFLLLQQGRPLTEKEMSDAYRRSFAVWNGYRRSTQSGVLPNSFMQGTPVIATRLCSFKEFVIPNKNGVFIDSTSFDDIANGLDRIKNMGTSLNEGCREFFVKNFYYGSQVDSFSKIIKSSTEGKMIR